MALKGASYIDLGDPTLCAMVIDVLRGWVKKAQENDENSATKLSDYLDNYIMPYYFPDSGPNKRANSYHPNQWAACYNNEIKNERFLMTTNSCESMHAELR